MQTPDKKKFASLQDFARLQSLRTEKNTYQELIDSHEKIIEDYVDRIDEIDKRRQEIWTNLIAKHELDPSKNYTITTDGEIREKNDEFGAIVEACYAAAKLFMNMLYGKTPKEQAAESKAQEEPTEEAQKQV